MIFKRFFVLFAALILVSSGFLSAEEVIGESVFMKIETPHPYSQTAKSEQAWVETYHYSGAGWIKPYFSQFRLNADDYLEIIDMNGIVVETIKGGDVSDPATSRFNVKKRGGKAYFWGPMVDGNEVTFILYSKSNGSDNWGFKIEEMGIGYDLLDDDRIPGYSTVESTCGGSDDKVDIECVSGSHYNNSPPVGRMHYKSGGNWYVCTGSLVSCNGGSQFLTNEHCINSQAIVDTLDVRFNYQYTNCSGSTVATYDTYYGDTYIKSSASLDYCLLTLKNSPQSKYGVLSISDRTVTVGETIYIIQHPGGGVKKYSTSVTLDASHADQYSNPEIEHLYYADTAGGSSGSPVFAASDNKVVGLHHTGLCPNEGVKMSKIFPQIKDDLGCGTGNQSPSASFTYTTNVLTVSFTDTSTDSDGSIVSWSWNFGDGNTSTQQNPSHTYASSGTYTVTLTVTDDGGATGSYSQDVTVSDGTVNITLSANGYKVRGAKRADLSWSGASGSNINIYRDGVLIATTANDGSYTDNIGKVKTKTFVYQVCETDGSACSNEVTVNF